MGVYVGRGSKGGSESPGGGGVGGGDICSGASILSWFGGVILTGGRGGGVDGLFPYLNAGAAGAQEDLSRADAVSERTIY